MGYQQQVERAMMSAISKEELERLYNSSEDVPYVSDPPLSTGLSGSALQIAKSRGGWKHSHELYDFLGITQCKRIYGK